MIESGMKYVSAGQNGFAAGDAILKTTVGPGLALLVHCAEYKCGGLLHLAGSAAPGRSTAHATAGINEEQLGDFFNGLLTHSRLSKDCFLEIVGGSDSLKTTPAHVRAGLIRERIEIVSNYAKKQNMTIGRVMVGGVRARSVTMDFSASRTTIKQVGGRKPSTVATSAPNEMNMRRVNGSRIIKVETGKIVADQNPNKLVAILGSCIGVALYDPSTGLGGMAHVLSPEQPRIVMEPGKYAHTAVAALIAVLERKGANRATMKAKMAGGANVLNIGAQKYRFRIGERNADIVRQTLADNKIPLLKSDVGGNRGRKMWINLRTFDMDVKFIQTEASKK